MPKEEGAMPGERRDSSEAKRESSVVADQSGTSVANHTGPMSISAEQIQDTLAFWQPRTTRKLTEEDARQINENVIGFFRVLREWDRADRIAEGSDGSSNQDSN